MANFWTLITIAALGGVAVTLQGQFMGAMSKQLGTLESVLITYGSGGLTIGLLMLALRGGNLADWRSVPWYTLSAGIMGLFIVGAIGYLSTRLGLVLTFTIMLASQFLLAAFFDHFGLMGASVRPLDGTRVIGVVVLLIGAWLTMR